jgi:transposase
LEFTNSLNQREKQELIIKLRKEEGKTYREIAHIAKVSLRDIKPTLRKYERKLQTKKREENNQQTTTKKLSLSSQAFILYQDGKKPSDVKVLLDIPFKLAIRYWKQYLKSIGMFESYEFYQDHSYDIPSLLSITNFMKRNNVYGNDIVKILRQIQDVISLNKMILNLKTELTQTKNNYLLNKNTNYLSQLLPLGLPPYYYEQL